MGTSTKFLIQSSMRDIAKEKEATAKATAKTKLTTQAKHTTTHKLSAKSGQGTGGGGGVMDNLFDAIKTGNFTT